MDSANKQTAVVSEVTLGTTPATPAFLLLRDSRVTGAPQRNDKRSPERRADRMAANMTTGLVTYQKTIEMPWVRDAGLDVLWASLFCGTWATNVLKNASTRQPFTLEEKYAGSGTTPYRRLPGNLVDSCAINFSNGNPGTLQFGLRAIGPEAMQGTAISGATYAVPAPGNDPSTPADILVNSAFGLTTPKVMSLQMTVSNNMEDRYGWGSAQPYDLGLGAFDVTGQIQFYFSQASDYSTFMTRQSGLTLDLTIGAVANAKDRLVLPKCDVYNPNVDDPGQSGANTVTLNFLARYDSTSTAAVTLTRNVA
ncbi:phage tail tube protein [Nitrobacter sp.]|uniref:phage tail tube protein n=1 Tax=Nitrobacter sp. TaxID=29420 RepID=UPI0029CAB69B|nr:phage tail tube protein [Nitrobacter sp.]